MTTISILALLGLLNFAVGFALGLYQSGKSLRDLDFAPAGSALSGDKRDVATASCEASPSNDEIATSPGVDGDEADESSTSVPQSIAAGA